MSNQLFYLYRSWGEQGYIHNISPKPELDLDYYAKKWEFARLEILSPKMSIAKASEFLNKLTKSTPGLVLQPESGPAPSLGLTGSPVFCQNQTPYAFKPGTCITANQVTSGKCEGILSGKYPGPEEYEVNRIRRLLAGRILLWEEVKARVSTGSGLSPCPWPLLDVLQVLYLTGSAYLMPGISYTAEGGFICNRCGRNNSIFRVSCADCGDECYQCEACLSMGASRTCTTLWAFPGDHGGLKSEPGKLIKAQLGFRLTQAQRDAAGQILKTVATEQALKTIAPEKVQKTGALEKDSRVLVWAACGAGKTEVSFGAIAYTLRQGGKVLFAIPRRDVVRELEPRLKQAFPDIKIMSLYGGSKDKYEEGDLILATTHQVIRYYRNFDLVVLDEVDAFPYRDSSMLHFAVERARKPKGKLVLMTATPEENFITEARSAGSGTVLVTIPSRHHGFPLPVPEIVVNKKIKLPPTGVISLPKGILELIFSSIDSDGCQLFLFVPQVGLAQRVAGFLREVLAADQNGQGIHFVHARDPNRDRKIQAFKNGYFPILVSTSIMERGVTISRCNVLVLMANQDHIFDSGTLIQMAGRAGRTTAYPGGKVWFVGDGISPAMKTAVRKIREMNNEAERRGYLVGRE